MEIKEVIKEIKEDLSCAELYVEGDGARTEVGLLRAKSKIEAYTVAISHLETLQKVKEMGGVRRFNIELKEALLVLENLCHMQSGFLPAYEPAQIVEALQTAISHLETLQKVKEMDEVKKREYADVSIGKEPTDDRDYDPAYVEGWNDALDAVHAELAGRLEGLEDIVKSYCVNILKIDITSEGAEKLATAIRSHILGTGKKEG